MRVYIEKTVLSGIAAAIRKRGNTTEHYFPSDMAAAIEKIPHDIECFRQETGIASVENVPIKHAGEMAHHFVIPLMTVKQDNA